MFHSLGESTNFEISDVIIDITIKRYTFDWFFKILESIKMKFSQTLQEPKANFSKWFLALLRRLETSFWSHYNFVKMAV